MTPERARPAGQGQGEQDTMDESLSPQIIHLPAPKVKPLKGNKREKFSYVHTLTPLLTLLDPIDLNVRQGMDSFDWGGSKAKGWISASVKTIAQRAGMGLRRVERSVKRLEEMGLIRTERRGLRSSKRHLTPAMAWLSGEWYGPSLPDGRSLQMSFGVSPPADAPVSDDLPARSEIIKIHDARRKRQNCPSTRRLSDAGVGLLTPTGVG
jgi:DNA-binding transcriptional ArsR family regulator